jgi:AcrR family transcriptional regulator
VKQLGGIVQMARKYADTAVRQEQITDAARKVIIKYGAEHLTIKRMAKEVGISETAVYKHFKSKKAILSALVDNIKHILILDITSTTREAQTTVGYIEASLRGHLSDVEQRKGISFQVIAEIISLGDKKLNQKMAMAIDSYTEELKNLLSEGVKRGEVRQDIDLEAAAMALFGMIQGLINSWALHNYSFDPLEKFASLWNIFREVIVKR